MRNSVIDESLSVERIDKMCEAADTVIKSHSKSKHPNIQGFQQKHDSHAILRSISLFSLQWNSTLWKEAMEAGSSDGNTFVNLKSLLKLTMLLFPFNLL